MGRVVGVDPGTKRIGVAVSDSARSLAFPRSSVAAGEAGMRALVDIVHEIGADLVVVGRPVSLSGGETSSTAVADEIRRQLVEELPEIDVVATDERLSTVSAAKQMHSAGVRSRAQRSLIDSAAATVLLQGFLDALAE